MSLTIIYEFDDGVQLIEPSVKLALEDEFDDFDSLTLVHCNSNTTLRLYLYVYTVVYACFRMCQRQTVKLVKVNNLTTKGE